MTFRWIEDHRLSPAAPVWTRAYAAELLPDPVTPLGWETVWDGGVVAGWRDALMGRFGFTADELDEDHPDIIAVFGGYAYLNVSMLRVWAARTPSVSANHVETAFLIDHPELPLYSSEPWHESPEATDGVLANWMAWVLTERTQTELDAGSVLAAEARAERPTLTGRSDMEVLDHALGLKPLLRALSAQHLNQLLAASIGPGIIGAICDARGLPTAATALISGLGDVESASPAHAMWTLSRLVAGSEALTVSFDAGVTGLLDRLRESADLDVVSFLAGFDALVSEIGHRGQQGWEPIGPTYETEPSMALAVIERLRHRSSASEPAQGFARREDQRRVLFAEVDDLIGDNEAVRHNLEAAMASTEVFVRGRERAKNNVTRVIHEMRCALIELGERATARGDLADPADLSLLFLDELTYYADGGLSRIREIVDERRAHLDRLRSSDPRPVIKSQPPLHDSDSLAWPLPSAPIAGPATAGDVLFGTPGCPGLGRGKVRIVDDLSSALAVEQGDVVVARSVPVVWMPLLVGVAGIVTEGGGLFSHATIVSRELGIPTVVRATDATTRLSFGTPIEVDGATGLVTVLDSLGDGAESGDQGEPDGDGASDDDPDRGNTTENSTA